MPRTNLSLGNLFRAVSGSVRTGAVSLSGLAGGGSNINLQSFSVDAVTGSVLFTYIVEGTSESASFTFTSQGTRHLSKVAPVQANYSVSSSQFTTGSLTAGSGNTTFAFTAGTIVGTAGAYGTERTDTMVLRYNDGFNVNATNYNSNINVTLILVDVYNTINEPDFCLTFGTKVKLADGTEINVEDVNVGDEIKAWVPAGLPDENQDPESENVDWSFHQLEELSGTPQTVIVRDLTFNFADGYYSINNGLIKATGTHPIYVWDSEIEKYKFKNISDIVVGDKLIKYTEENGEEEVLVESINYIEEATEIVTINVENSDVFISNNLVSHNKGTTTQPMIPGNGLRMYLDPSKTISFPGGTLPSTGTPTTDWLDITGWNTGFRPAGQPPISLAGGNPSYNNGGSRKERYYSFDGGDYFFKDRNSNINDGTPGPIAFFDTTALTFLAWVRLPSNLGQGYECLFSKAGADRDYNFYLYAGDNSVWNGFHFSSARGTVSNSVQTFTAPSLNVWYMVGFSISAAAGITYYLDGVSQGTGTMSAFNATSTYTVKIGADDNFYGGHLGPVLYYDRVLTQTEITRAYNHFSPTYK